MVSERAGPRLAGWLVFFCLVGLSAFAHAEAGDGLKAGNLKISPSLTVSGKYDNNVFRTAPDERQGRGQFRSPILGIGPGLEITTPNPAGFDFSLDASANWDQYLTSDEVTRDQSGLNANLGANGTINPKGGVSFKLSEKLTLTNEPPPSPSGTSYNRLLNKFGGTVGIHPGARILRLDLGYRLSLFRHITLRLRDLDKTSHDFQLDFAWKFLPRTSFVVEGNASLIRYREPTRDLGGDELRNVNSEHLGAKGGLSGLLSRRFSARLLAGYEHGFYRQGSEFRGFVTNSSLAYLIGNVKKENKIQLSYELDYDDSSIGNYVLEHNGELNYTQKFGDGRLQLDSGLGYTYRDYSALPLPDSDSGLRKQVRSRQGDLVFIPKDLEDSIFSADIGLTVNIFKWWSATASYDFSWNSTSDRIEVLYVTGDGPNYLREYQRHAASLSTTIRY